MCIDLVVHQVTPESRDLTHNIEKGMERVTDTQRRWRV